MREEEGLKYRRATVWWHDAHSGDGLKDAATVVKEHRPMLVARIGWVVQDDDAGISLGWEYNDPAQNPHVSVYDFRATMFIPRGMIVRVEYHD